MPDAGVSAQAVEAAAQWGGSVTRLIRDRENAVFEVALPDGRAALRLHRKGYQSAAAIRSELWWTGALADAGVPVPRPVPTRAGDMLVRLGGGRIATMIGWVDGAAIGEAGVPLAGDAAAQAQLHRALGRLLAQVHAVSDRLSLPPSFARPRWDAAGLVGDAPFWGRFWDHPALTPDERSVMLRVRDLARERLADTALAEVGLIHADVLRENVLQDNVRDGPALTLIDFDDCGQGFRLYDLGTALSQNLTEPALPRIAAALAQGYAEVRPLPQTAADALPLFTLLRCCASVGWTMPRLAPGDPRHRAYIDRATRAAQTVLAGGALLG